MEPPPLPPGWRKHESKREGGKAYYYHGPTGKSQWHLPVAAAAAAPSRKRPRPRASAAAAKPVRAKVAKTLGPAIDPTDPKAALRRSVRLHLKALILAAQSKDELAASALPPPEAFTGLDRSERYVVEEEADEFGLVAVETQHPTTREKTMTVYHRSHDIPGETNFDKTSRATQSAAQSAAATAAAAKRRKLDAARKVAEEAALRSSAGVVTVKSLNVDKRDRRLVQDIEEELAAKKSAAAAGKAK